MNLLTAGYNKSNLLCRKGKNKIPLAVDMLPNIEKIKCLSLGFLKGVAVYNDGSVLGWGGSFSEKNPSKDEKPYKISGLSNIVTAKSGYLFDIFLDEEGNVFYLAKLDHSIRKIKIEEPIVDVFGYETAYVVGKSGNLYKIQNVSQTAEKIELNFDTNDRIQNVVSVSKSTIVLTQNNRVFGIGSVVSNSTQFIEIESLQNKCIEKVDGMFNSILALTKSGEVYVNGNNSNGQIGLAKLKQTEPTHFLRLEFAENVKIVDFAASHSFSLFLDENGYIWSTGTSTDGCLLQGANSVSCQIPTKVTLIQEKVTSILCGSCFCYIQLGGRPLSRNSMLKYEECSEKNKKKKSLPLGGICSYLSFANMNEFHFLFGDFDISVNRLFADFISPKVAQLHYVDPTIDSFVVSKEKDRIQIECFEKIIQMAKGEKVEVNFDELPLIGKLSKTLSNDELLESVLNKFKTNLSLSNVFSIVELEMSHFSVLSNSTKKFLAENFCSILKNHQEDFCRLNLDDETMRLCLII